MISRIEIKEEDFEGLKDILVKGENNDINVVVNRHFNTIWFMGIDEMQETDLYIKSIYSKYLVISRIMFDNTHCGIGTKVFNWLKEYCIEKGYAGIEVESTCTKEINNFCDKFKFEKVPNIGFYEHGIFWGNYRLTF